MTNAYETPRSAHDKLISSMRISISELENVSMHWFLSNQGNWTWEWGISSMTSTVTVFAKLKWKGPAQK